MRRFELGMTLDYASDWGITDAVREFFQNAMDEEKMNPENKMTVEYDEEMSILRIGNRKSNLMTKSLLLGGTTKLGRTDVIGRHGEGYKVATVVLMRNNIKVVIYNNESGEVWSSRVVKSKRYGADIVCFDIEKKFFNKKENLVVEIEGITKAMYDDIVEKNLNLRDDIGEVRKYTKGSVLLDEKFKGKIYVEGLFVCENKNIDKGYNFNAELIRLDRDRGLVDTFDIRFAISNLVSSDEDVDYVAENIESDDFLYAKSFYYSSSKGKGDLSDRVYEKFRKEYGEDKIPVADTDTFNSYKSMGLDPVMVKPQVAEIINVKPREFLVGSVKVDERLENWISDWKYLLNERAIAELRSIWYSRE